MNRSSAPGISLQTIMFPILAISASTAFFYFAAPIIVPLVAAFSLSYLLLPLVNLLKRLKVNHSGAVIIVMVAALGIFILLALLIIGEISDLATSFSVYNSKVFSEIVKYVAIIESNLGLPAGTFGIEKTLLADAENFRAIGKYLFKGIGSITSFTFGSILMMFVTLFMLLDSPMFEQKMKYIFGKSNTETTNSILVEINRQLKNFIQIRFAISIGLALVCTLGLLILDVKYAYIWGLLAGFANLIPYIGAVVSAIPPIIVAGIQHGSTAYMVYVAIFFTVVQVIEGNIITPRLTSNSVNLNTLAVLISTTYWGWLWGGVGIILAIPITAAIKVICDNVEQLKPIGILLGSGRNEINH